MEVVMKRMTRIICSCFFIASIFSSILPAQSDQGSYMHIDYLEIDRSETETFNEKVQNTLKPVQQARIDNDFIDEWYLYEVAFPGNQNSTYNHVIITVSNSLSGFEDIHLQVDGNTSVEESLLMDYQKYLNPNHSEIWGVRNSVFNNSSANHPSRYIRINYMDVNLGNEYEYQMFEDEIARPLHEDRMEADRMNGWELYQLIVPGGTEYGYNFSTADFYNKLEHIEFGFTEELIQINHPDTDINEFFENIYRTRDLVRSEIWELVEHLD